MINNDDQSTFNSLFFTFSIKIFRFILPPNLFFMNAHFLCLKYLRTALFLFVYFTGDCRSRFSERDSLDAATAAAAAWWWLGIMGFMEQLLLLLPWMIGGAVAIAGGGAGARGCLAARCSSLWLTPVPGSTWHFEILPLICWQRDCKLI